MKEKDIRKVQYHLDIAIHAIGHAFESAGRGDELRCEKEMSEAMTQMLAAKDNLPCAFDGVMESIRGKNIFEAIEVLPVSNDVKKALTAATYRAPRLPFLSPQDAETIINEIGGRKHSDLFCRKVREVIDIVTLKSRYSKAGFLGRLTREEAKDAVDRWTEAVEHRYPEIYTRDEKNMNINEEGLSEKLREFSRGEDVVFVDDCYRGILCLSAWIIHMNNQERSAE